MTREIRLILFYTLIVLLFFSCKPSNEKPVKVKKIAVHTFTGKGENGEITNWFYIKNISDRGYSGFYLETALKTDDLKQMHFSYSAMRPSKFDGESAAEEKIQFLDVNELPENIIRDSADLESLYQ